MTTYSGLPSSQNQAELMQMIGLMGSLGAKSYLEIGSRDGDTFYEVVTSLPRGSFAVAVDLPGGPWGRKSQQHLTKCVEELRRIGYRVGLVFGDSTRPEVIDRVSANRFDAILIDGDHRYEGVKADWQNYAGLANKMVAFHDIAGDGVVQKASGMPVEVPRLWREISPGLNTREFIEPGSKMGIGAIIV